MNIIKKKLIKIFLQFLKHETIQNELDKIHSLRKPGIKHLTNKATPYKEILAPPPVPSLERQSVFISARFRSGSTLIWNIFRNTKNCTAYYEPFNERQWFNSKLRGKDVDSTHIGVDDYWKEYEGKDNLGEFYCESWIREGLLMTEQSWNPAMKSYIDHLLRQSAGHAVLQFNRVDFRLPWLKHHFPDTKIIHLYRHPRDQWLSFLTNKETMNSSNVLWTYEDNFYLDVWCKDLEKFFPFLSSEYTPHPYQRFYYIWKLSYLYGAKYSDISISFEELTSAPEKTLGELFSKLKWDDANWQNALPIVEPTTLGKWKNYAGDDWFSTFEARCERTLDCFLEAGKS